MQSFIQEHWASHTRARTQNNILLDELFNCRLELGSTILGMKAFANNKVDFVIASCASLLECTIRKGDGFFNVQTVQIDFVGSAILYKPGE